MHAHHFVAFVFDRDLAFAVRPQPLEFAGLAQQVLASSDRLGTPADQQGEWSLDAADPFERDLRTLTAPEQEVRIREILHGTVSSGSVDWPAEWKPALGTRTFARELRRAVAHARRWGWEPDDLCREARASGGPGGDGVGRVRGRVGGGVAFFAERVPIRSG